jgi:hypothetical protein
MQMIPQKWRSAGGLSFRWPSRAVSRPRAQDALATPINLPAGTWIDRFGDWLDVQGWLKRP